MKNKRTKLTALLLSALMAVSTISSVTWAADLFSDGSEVEEVAEEAFEIVTDVEDENLAEDEALTGISEDRIDLVVFDLGNDNNVYATIYYHELGTAAPAPGVDVQKDEKEQKKVVLAEKSRTIQPQTCKTPEIAVYTVSVDVDDSTTPLTISSAEEGSGKKVQINADTLKYWKDGTSTKYVTEITGNNDNVHDFTGSADGVIVVPDKNKPLGGKVGHQVAFENGKPVLSYKVLTSGACDKPGIQIGYYACKECGAVLYSSQTAEGVYYTNVLYESKIDPSASDILTSLLGKGFTIDQDFVYTSKNDPGSDQLPEITASEVPANAHNFEGVSTQIVSDTDFIYKYDVDGDGDLDSSQEYDPNSQKWVKSKEYTKIVANGEPTEIRGGSPLNNYEIENGEKGNDWLKYAPFNCIGTQIADPENGRDSFYYTYVVCKNCHKVVRIVDRVYLKNTSGSVEGDYYEEVEGGNVIGFLAKPNSSGTDVVTLDSSKYKLYGYVRSYISFEKAKYGRISTSDTRLLNPLVPVLQNCEQNGYYYIRKYVKDSPDPVDTERKTVERVSHLWGSIEVAPKGLEYTDGTKSTTENDKLLDIVDLPNTKDNFRSGNFVVVRDGNGNVVEAKSKNCITTANYELYHQCLICGKKVKTEVKTAQYNTDRHWWPDWSTTTDDEDNKYYQIEGPEHDTYHMKYTYYHRICNWCGKRELDLADEIKEPHRLRETAYDDDYDKDGKDSTLVEPTCGVDGHYDVILRCACRYEDDQSIKQATIPATDKHEFGDNKIVVNVVGDIHVGDDGNKDSKKGDNPYVVYAEVGRICTVCEKLDSNGINNTAPGKVGVDDGLIIDTVREGRTIEVTEAKKDENGIPYPCSVGTATITFNWSGKLDGKAVKAETVTKTVPYYPSLAAYTGRRDHVTDVRYEDEVKPTATQEGSRVKVTFCTVCGDDLLRETETLAKLGSAPTVKATPVNYNTVNVTWDAVDGAESYKVFNKSNALGINKWQLVATVDGTSYTDTGLVTGAKYRYTVKPVVNGIGGEYSKKGVVVCPKLTAPEIKSVTSVGTNKNKITWTKVDGASGYIVQRKAANGSWTRIATVRGGSNINCRDKKAVAGASYRIRAFRTVEKPNFVKSNVYGPFSTAK